MYLACHERFLRKIKALKNFLIEYSLNEEFKKEIYYLEVVKAVFNEHQKILLKKISFNQKLWLKMYQRMTSP
jgi:hypothetical protein